ncbi:MAG: nucleotide exchange factor GrpE [Cryomorphaceae bacterium]|nr:nucleotide exchange factor GrpE [Cryomorphaceae bacterium]
MNQEEKNEVNEQEELHNQEQATEENLNEAETVVDNGNIDPAAEWKDRYTRLYAEFDNFRKRTQRERIDLIRTASGEIISAMLPVLDDFERAIKANEASEDHAALKEGFVIIHNKMRNILEIKGLKPMDSMGQVFDTEFHEAITNIPAPSDDLKGKVVDVVEKGYFINDNVLRYAKVVVGQ